MSDSEKFIFEDPIEGYCLKGERKYLEEIEELSSKIHLLTEENQKLKQSKEVRRFYEIPMTVS